MRMLMKASVLVALAATTMIVVMSPKVASQTAPVYKAPRTFDGTASNGNSVPSVLPSAPAKESRVPRS